MKTNQPLVAKEIRLLMPAYAVALLLAALPVWLLPKHPYIDATTGTEFFAFCGLWFGMVMLALSSFGREFAMNTFPMLLAQPSERNRIWFNKTVILACATLSILVVWTLSFVIRYYFSAGEAENFDVLSHWTEFISVGAASALVIFSSGLCWTILLRQIAAAFWFTVLVPVVIIVLHEMAGTPDWLDYAMLAGYSLATFLWARRLFYQAQEVGWTGGTIALPGWLSGDAAQRATRSRRPLSALFWKEFQLHQVGLVGIGVLFLLHLGVIAVRKLGGHSLSDTTRTGLDVFGGLWLLVPLFIGATSVADERKLGVMQAHLTLPVSRRLQFFFKLLTVLLVGGLLSALLLWTAEGIASRVGAGCNAPILRYPFDSHTLFVLCCAFAGLSLLCFYASTLVEGLIQALAAAVSTATICGGVAFLAVWLLWAVPEHFGFMLWTQDLLCAIALPILVVTIIWLAYRNFKTISVGGRLWCQNILSVVAVLLGIGIFTSCLYNRVWEYLTPLEPAHGPARFTVTDTRQPTLSTYYLQTLPSQPNEIKLNAVLSDGRIWTGIIGTVPEQGSPGYETRLKHWGILPGHHFLPGSNWANIASTHSENVVVRDDGSLWVSEKPSPAWSDAIEANLANHDPHPLVQFGTETNWKSVIGWHSPGVMLLKRDGSLWLWSGWPPPTAAMPPPMAIAQPPTPTPETGTKGTNNPVAPRQVSPQMQPVISAPRRPPAWPGLQAFQPRLLLTQTNWTEISHVGGNILAWNADGECWMIYQIGRALRPSEIQIERGTVMKRIPILDHLNLRTVVEDEFYYVSLGNDGKLWGWPRDDIWPDWNYTPAAGRAPMKAVQIGIEKDWTSLESFFNGFVARKADGSIWKWDQTRLQIQLNVMLAHGLDIVSKMTPERLGTHDDWLAVASPWDIFMAADGSIWAWSDRVDDYPGRYSVAEAWSARSWDLLLSPSRKPTYIGNILDNQK